MHLAIFIILYLVVQFSMGNHNPFVRLSLFFSIPSLYIVSKKFKDQIQRFSTHKLIILLLVLVSLLRVGQFTRKMMKTETRTEDIAIVYKESIELIFKGQNPYLKPLDPYPLHYKNNNTYFDRPKYTPLQIFTYAPFVYFLGLKGIYLGNLIVYLLLGFFFFSYFKPTNKHYLSLLIMISGEFVFNKLFSKGVNDLLPAYLSLLSWTYLTDKKKAGSLLGLSFLTKQLPAGIFGLWFLLLKQWKAFLLSVPIVLALTIPFFIYDIKAAFENLILFNLIRPVRETSLLLYLPETLQKIISYLGIITAVFLPLVYKSRWGIPFIGLTVFILTSKMSPGNYFIWAFPFLLMWILEEESSIELSKK